MHSLVSLFMITLLAYSIKLITMNHDDDCTCVNGICTHVKNGISQSCACAWQNIPKYSPRTSFPTTCSTNNDVNLNCLLIKLFIFYMS